MKREIRAKIAEKRAREKTPARISVSFCEVAYRSLLEEQESQRRDGLRVDSLSTLVNDAVMKCYGKRRA